MSIDLEEINIDLLNDCGYENYLADCDPSLIDYQIKLTNAAKEKKQNGNDDLGSVLDLLSLACAPILQSSNDKKPFSHHCLTKEQAKLFCQFAKVVGLPELKARLADLAWVILRDYASAKIAINAYTESTENIYFQRN